MPKAIVSKQVRLRERGQLTIPADIREQLGISQESILRLIPVGQGLMVIPEATVVNELSRHVEQGIKQENLSLEELLSELREGSHDYEVD